ncbi:Uma2 family endonuclease [Acinetobacter puyangensis]|uniref:Endonuclease, Uma2 family (Restriction endonuclease fold) n=1 Tax=Acinetobacter puyangensis TaxID=1096779 RepID=A0A240E7S5_9GAMM|nr:Uma2 family endonuclease [Acinetobacter puyangensis]SNX44571.1 Endonuclease, Uma2 family (restriction endonuclease fold) [Acinetobacter puyangensis]
MANLASPLKLSEQDYLAGELHSEIKHEYIDGEVFAMVGSTANHNTLAGNVFLALGNHLKGKPCRPFTSDMKVKIGTKYFYPDVLVDCSNISGQDIFTQTPILIVEVLFKSTQQYDKTLKLKNYLKIDTLLEYILIEQDKAEIQVLRRTQGWQPNYYFLGDDVTFESVGLTVPVEELYDQIQNDDMSEWLEQKAQTDED